MVINAQESEVVKSQIEHYTTRIPAASAENSVDPSSTGRRQRHAAETRLRLFRCAVQLFAERGYSNVTVEDITEAADVGKGTFFNYFESKDHVLGVLAEIQLGKVAEAVQRAANSKEIHTVFHRLFLRLAEEPGRSPELARTIISSFLVRANVRRQIALHMENGRKMIAKIVADGQESGQIDRSLKPDQVARQMVQTIMGTVLFWSLHEEPALSLWIEDSFQHFWRAIAVSDKGQA